MSDTIITGGCLCGAVRYEMTEAPVDGGFCHCRTCQKLSGGLNTVSLIFLRTAFRFTKGEPKFFASSEFLDRAFCTECGGWLGGFYKGNPGSAVIAVGTLDHPDDWPMEQDGWFGHCCVDDKVSWEVIADGLPHLDQFSADGIVTSAQDWVRGDEDDRDASS